MQDNNDILDYSEQHFEDPPKKQFKMTKNWRHLEILIGIILSISALFVLYLCYQTLIFYVDLFERFSKSHLNISNWFQIFKKCYLIFLNSCMMLTGGVFLIFEKKFAWIFSVLSSTYGLMFFLIVLFKIDQINSGDRWILYAFISFFLFLLIALFFKPFRTKYQTTKKEWVIMFLALIVFLLERFLI